MDFVIFGFYLKFANLSFIFNCLEFKCQECMNKAQGVCMKCILTRFCFKCFEKLHENDLKLKYQHHEFTFYVHFSSFSLKFLCILRKKSLQMKRKSNYSVNPLH